MEQPLFNHLKYSLFILCSLKMLTVVQMGKKGGELHYEDKLV